MLTVYDWLGEATNSFPLSRLFSAKKGFPTVPESECASASATILSNKINETWEAVYDLFLFLNMNQICNLLDVGLYRNSFSVQPEPFSRKKRPQSPPPGFRDTNPTTRNETHIVEPTTKRSDSYPATIRPSDMCSAVVPVKASSIGQVRDPVHATQAHQSNTGCHLPTETTTQQQPL